LLRFTCQFAVLCILLGFVRRVKVDVCDLDSCWFWQLFHSTL